MKSVLVALVLAVAVASAADLDLTPDNFDEYAKGDLPMLSMFYAPWCGHCKKLKPAFTEAANELEGKAVLAKVDCTEHQELCGRFDVRGYPTLVFFKGGDKRPYDGPRTAEGIVSWVERKSGPASVQLNSAEEVAAFVAKTPAVVGYFSAAEGDDFDAFQAAADAPNSDGIRFGQVTDAALFGGAAAGSAVFHRGADIGEDKTYTIADEEDLAQTVFADSFKAVDQIGPDNFGKYADLGRPLFLAFVDLGDADSKSAVVDALAAAQKAHPDSTYGYIDGVQFKANMKRMGASGDVMPCIIRLNFADNKPIVFEDDITTDAVTAWVDGIYAGDIKYVPKTEPVPEDNDGPVRVIVGSTFEAEVLESDKDVLVEFYAPWCGHCKKLAPAYEKVGEALADADNVVIAKLDLTANDVEPNHQVRGFPTLLLYKNGDKANPIVFEGERTAEAIEAFVRENAASLAGAAGDKDEL